MLEAISAVFGKHGGLGGARRDGQDRRSEPRSPQSGRTISLAVGDQTAEFYVIDISRGGIGGRCEANLRKGQKVILTFGHDSSVPGRVRWRSGSITGIQFLNPLPNRLVGQLLGAASRAEPRVETSEKVFIIGRSGNAFPATMKNVSASGMLIETNVALLSGQKLKVRSARGRVIDARVAWFKDGKAGLEMCAPSL